MTIWKYEEEDRTVWYKGNDYHRLDGPAMEYHNGRTEWWVEGKRHHTNGPAITTADGTLYWFLNGVRHRMDGPAVEYFNGDKEWWVDGKEVDIFAIFGYEPSVPLTEEQQMVLRLSV